MKPYIQRHATLWRRAGGAILTALILVLMTPAAAHALEVRNGDAIVIGPDEVLDDDLMVTANRFTLEGTVNGNLSVVGEIVTINGTVNGDLNIVGRSVTINGTIQRARIAGQAIVLGPRSNIDRHLMAAAATLDQQEGGQIGTDLIFAGLRAIISGSVGARSSDGETGATHGMRLVTFTPPDLHTPASLLHAQVETPAERQAALTAGLSAILRWFASLLIIGLLLVWLAPDLLRGAAEHLTTRPLPSLGWGIVAVPALFLAFFVVLFALILLFMAFNALGLGDMVTLTLIFGGLSLAALVALTVVMLIYVGNIISGYVLGNLILRRTQPAWAERPIVPLVLGVLIISLLSSIPGLGFVVKLVATLLGLGGLWQIWFRRSAQPVPPLPAASTQPV